MDVKESDAGSPPLSADMALFAAHAGRPPDTPWPDATKDAIARFYKRFKRRVHAFCCRRIRSSLPRDHSVEDFVTDLFLRFLRSADKFKLQNAGCDADAERQILASFHKHAIWQRNDALRSRQRDNELIATIAGDLTDSTRIADERPSPELETKRAQLRDALAKDDRTRDVLFTSYGHTDQSSGKFALPAQVRDELCRRCNFESANAMVKFRSRKIEELRMLLAIAPHD